MSANATRLSDLPLGQENITYQISSSMPGGMPSTSFTRNSIVSERPGENMNEAFLGGQSNANNYIPLNVHPNPYGNAVPSVDSIPFPSQVSRPGKWGEDGGPSMEANDPASREGMSTDYTSLDRLKPLPDTSYEQNQNPSSPPSHPQAPAHILPEMLPKEMQRLPSRDIPQDTTRLSQDEAVQANYIPPPPPKRVKDYIKEYDATEAVTIRQHEKEKYHQEWYENLFRLYQHPLLIVLLYFLFEMQFITKIMFTYLGKWSWLYSGDGHLTPWGMAMKSVLFTSVYVAITHLLMVL